jgi:alkaline phosphatase D
MSTRFLLFLLIVPFSVAADVIEIPDSLKNPLLKPFYFGVASGDPTQSSVIIWTHVSPEESSPAEVIWQMARDTLFSEVVASGVATALPQREYTVKVDVEGLSANTWYYYRFVHKGQASITGRTRTMPSTEIEQMRFAVYTCADFKDGYFNAYARIVERNDVDAIIHLGDYIYESRGDTSQGQRPVLPDKRCESLGDYRTRYAFYRLDPFVRAAHQQFPWYCVWDDHEFANDAWKDGSDRYQDADWLEIKEIGLKVYSEWMPLRYPYQNDSLRIFRSFDMGPSIDLFMLDVRLVGREEPLPFTNQAHLSSNRTMMGAEQKAWFKQSISASTSKWKIVAQQNLMADYRVLGIPAPGTEKVWNNFPAERTEILSHLLSNNITNVVVLTGDVHSAFVNDLPANRNNYNANTGAGSAAIEFVTPSLTSASDIDLPFQLLKSNNAFAQFSNVTNRGYMILDVTPDTISGNFYWTPYQTINETETFGGAFCSAAGSNRVRNCQTERRKNGPAFPLAPETPGTFVTGVSKTLSQDIKWIAFPNPSSGMLQVRLNVPSGYNTDISLGLYNLMGQSIRTVLLPESTYQYNFDISQLPEGMYLLELESGDTHSVLKIIKE